MQPFLVDRTDGRALGAARRVDGLGRGEPTRVVRLGPGGRHATVVALVAATAAVALRWRPRRVEVRGASMEPTLHDGDHLLVVGHLPARVGAVVALRDPRQPSRLLVKRVAGIGAAGIDVRGDNPAASTDSRTFGPVPAATVVGRAVWRYAPPDRAGRIGGGRRPRARGGRAAGAG